MSQIKNRSIPGDQSRDPSIVELLTYNEPSGGRKSVAIGPHLIPLGDGAGGYTTDATTARNLGVGGKNLAIFNKSNTTDYSITLGDSTVAAQAIGAIQAGTQFVGIGCPPNWSYVSAYSETWVVTNNNNLVVYIIDDPTYIVVQPANNAKA